MIDQSLVILGKDAQFSGYFQAKTKTCDVTFLLEAHGAQELSQKFQPPPRIILIELLAQASNIETCANEFSRNLESVGAGFWILKRARVGGDRRVKIFRDVPIERQALTLNQAKNNFSCGRSRRIDINDVAIAGITQMMVNINPDFRRPNCWQSSAKPILNCRVERDGNIEILRSGRRLGEQLRPGKERILLQHSIFIPYADFFSECLKRKRQRNLAAQRIAVWTNMTQDREPTMVA